jgi:hypothetical protein
MNKFTHKLLVLGLLLAWQSAFAQTDSVEVVVPEGQATTTVINNPAPNEAPDAGNSEQGEVVGGNANPIEAEEGGFLIKDANINDIFQLLAKRADKQYFHNNKLNTVDYQVTGHLSGDVDSLQQMEELAFQYGLRMYVKGNTVYAMICLLKSGPILYNICVRLILSKSKL